MIANTEGGSPLRGMRPGDDQLDGVAVQEALRDDFEAGIWKVTFLWRSNAAP